MTPEEIETIRTALEDEIVRLFHENARLREALRPFADAARIIDASNEADGQARAVDASVFKFQGAYSYIVLADCRRAAEVLGEKP